MMTPEESTGIARAVADTVRPLVARLDALAEEVRTLRAERADPVAALLVDGAGTLHLVQRGGQRLEAHLPDVAALVATATAAARETIRTELGTELHAAVARSCELYFNPPSWSAGTVYGEGEIVQADVGRTYRVRKGIRATTGRVPGEHAEHWERLGTGGFRVLKSRPEALAPGDVFTEHDARFVHDGRETILFVPKAPKTSDVERAVKAPYALGQANQVELREHAARIALVLEDVQRSTQAANDAGEIGAQALAQVEALHRELAELHARVEQLAAAGGVS